MNKLLIILILNFSSLAIAETTATLTAGPLLGLGSLRIGKNDWEAGLLGSGCLGIYSIARQGDFYFGVGPGMSVHYETGYGLRGALGLERELWRAIYIKLEASSFGASNGMTSGELQAGLTMKLK